MLIKGKKTIIIIKISRQYESDSGKIKYQQKLITKKAIKKKQITKKN